MDVRNLALSLLQEVVSDQHPEFGGGALGVAAYDTAWVAMVRDPNAPHDLAFPRSFDWLLRHQAADGSWGAAFPHTLLPTLAGLLAMLKSPRQTAQTSAAASRAEHYLGSALARWSVDRHESVGFEIVAPALLRELEGLGKRFDFQDKERLMMLHAEKLLIAGPELIYSGQSNLIHSLEAFGGSLDFARLRTRRAANGAYGCSAAATAAVLIHAPEWDAAAARWLAYLTERAFGGEAGAMPTTHPIDTFETAWVVYNLAHGALDFTRDVPRALAKQVLTWLQDSLTADGASTSRFAGIPFDSDDTGMVVAALNAAGVATPADSLRRFERASHFACFERERGVSVSANAHVLAALVSLPPRERAQWADSIAKVVEFLYGARQSDGPWLDKWHVTPFYATACSVMALVQCADASTQSRLMPTIDWLLRTHDEHGGGWGLGHESTVEDTAYALQSLLSMRELIPAEQRASYDRVVGRGRRHLREHLEQCMQNQGLDLPRLWYGKEPYVPPRVVLSAVLATVGSPADAP